MKNVICHFLIFAGMFLISGGLYSQNSVVIVPGTSDWVDTGFSFDGEQVGFVFASGYVIRHDYASMSFDNYATPAGRGPNLLSNSFPCQTCNATSLIGKLGVNGDPFLVGERAYIKGAGRLFLTVNDSPLSDNQGALVAVIYKDLASICTGNRPGGVVLSNEEAEKKGDPLAESEKETTFNLYPNPASQAITVEIENATGSTEIKWICIYDIKGQLVKIEEGPKLADSKISISTPDLPQGTYLVSVLINQEVKSKKLIIN